MKNVPNGQILHHRYGKKIDKINREIITIIFETVYGGTNTINGNMIGKTKPSKKRIKESKSKINLM